MGNTVPPRMCRKEAGTGAAGGTAAARRRPKNVAAEAVAPAVPRRVAATPRKQRDGEVAQEMEEASRAGCRRARGVPGAGGVGADDNVVGKAPAGTVVTVKIVMKRKDAEALVARLNAQSARERKARMTELKGELRAGDCGGGASPAPCRDAWKPRLAPIKEN